MKQIVIVIVVVAAVAGVAVYTLFEEGWQGLRGSTVSTP